MDQNLNWLNEKRIEKTIKSLENNNMKGYLVSNKEELLKKIEEIVKAGSLVGCGGSMTLFETGVIDFIREKYNFLDRYAKDIKPEEMKEIYRKSFSADAYFTSTNAITEDGELYNLDGNGNRVAAMIYGPDKVIVIAGVNKIVKDVDEAIKRTKTIAAPANCKRLSTNTGCKTTGICIDCSSPGRICCSYTLIKRQLTPEIIHVIFLNEDFGY